MTSVVGGRRLDDWATEAPFPLPWFVASGSPFQASVVPLTISHPEALPWRVKSSGIRQSKITKGLVLASLGGTPVLHFHHVAFPLIHTNPSFSLSTLNYRLYHCGLNFHEFYAHFLSQMCSGSAEEHTALSRALSNLAEVEEKVDKIIQNQVWWKCIHYNICGRPVPFKFCQHLHFCALIQDRMANGYGDWFQILKQCCRQFWR